MSNLLQMPWFWWVLVLGVVYLLIKAFQIEENKKG